MLGVNRLIDDLHLTAKVCSSSRSSTFGCGAHWSTDSRQRRGVDCGRLALLRLANRLCGYRRHCNRRPVDSLGVFDSKHSLDHPARRLRGTGRCLGARAFHDWIAHRMSRLPPRARHLPGWHDMHPARFGSIRHGTISAEQGSVGSGARGIVPTTPAPFSDRAGALSVPFPGYLERAVRASCRRKRDDPSRALHSDLEQLSERSDSRDLPEGVLECCLSRGQLR